MNIQVTQNIEEEKLQILKNKCLEHHLRMKELTVADIMTREVLACDYNDLTAKVVRLLLEKNQLGLLIIKDRQAFNFVTIFDLLRLSYEEVFDMNRDYLRYPIGELVKDREFITLEPQASLINLLDTMIEKHVHTIVITKGQEVRGVCSLTQFLEWYRKNYEEF